jgi:hypothetical protein
MPGFWEQWDEKIQENATGILGTVAFHLVLIAVFLAIKISTEKSLLESLIILEFEEDPTEEELNLEEPDPEFEEKLAHFLEEPASNVPVNMARQIDRELSTEEYLKELEEDLESNRPEEYEEMQERLKELEEMEREELSMEAEDIHEQEPAVYEGPTNIYYDLEFRYHLKLPVPVYKCEGAGLIEVKIVVDQRGRVIKAETDKPGDTANEICLAEAAIIAARKTRFNADYDAPPNQIGTITYHFIAQ